MEEVNGTRSRRPSGWTIAVGLLIVWFLVGYFQWETDGRQFEPNFQAALIGHLWVLPAFVIAAWLMWSSGRTAPRTRSAFVLQCGILGWGVPIWLVTISAELVAKAGYEPTSISVGPGAIVSLLVWVACSFLMAMYMWSKPGSTSSGAARETEGAG